MFKMLLTKKKTIKVETTKVIEYKSLPARFGSADAATIGRSKDLWFMKGKHCCPIGA